jgi:hypothetical protein
VVTSIVVFIVIPLSSAPRHSGDERGQSTVNADSGRMSGAASSLHHDDDRRSTASHKLAPPEDREARGPSSTSPSSKTASVVGAWDEVITNPARPDSVAADLMRHVFRPDGTVTVRMDDGKPSTFTWTSVHGKYVVVYKYGSYDHPREFRLRSADEADAIESNDKVIASYVREGSALAQRKSRVVIFEPAGTTKIILDVNALLIGGSYALTRETSLMPDPVPRDPVAALELVQNLPAGSTFVVLDKRTISGVIWYQIRTAANARVTGWLKSIALIGQDLRVAGGGAGNE